MKEATETMAVADWVEEARRVAMMVATEAVMEVRTVEVVLVGVAAEETVVVAVTVVAVAVVSAVVLVLARPFGRAIAHRADRDSMDLANEHLVNTVSIPKNRFAR